MLHDEEKYPNPGTFLPERFLNEDGSLRSDARFPTEPFGFGRRICPGKELADASLWIMIVTVLATLDVYAPEGEGGLEGRVEYCPGIIRCVPPSVHLNLLFFLSCRIVE